MRTLEISEALHERIATRANNEGRPMHAVVADAIEVYENTKFADEFNAAVERTRADPIAWAEYQAETAIFDQVAGDGLGTDDIPEYDLPEDGGR